MSPQKTGRINSLLLEPAIRSADINIESG